MDAPVGVPAEEAGDAGLLFAPHHAQSIPASAARGNRGAKYFNEIIKPAHVDSRACSTLLCPRCFVAQPLLPLPFRVCFRNGAQPGFIARKPRDGEAVVCATDDRHSMSDGHSPRGSR
jgi:hypothetical protein